MTFRSTREDWLFPLHLYAPSNYYQPFLNSRGLWECFLTCGDQHEGVLSLYHVTILFPVFFACSYHLCCVAHTLGLHNSVFHWIWMYWSTFMLKQEWLWHITQNFQKKTQWCLKFCSNLYTFFFVFGLTVFVMFSISFPL